MDLGGPSATACSVINKVKYCVISLDFLSFPKCIMDLILVWAMGPFYPRNITVMETRLHFSTALRLVTTMLTAITMTM